MMNRNRAVLLGMMALLAGIAVVLAGFRGVDAKPSYEGERLAFSLPDLDGNMVSMTDERFAEKVVFVDLWGTWCPPCISEIPTFNDVQRELGGDGLVVVGIAFEDPELDDPVQHLREAVERHSIEYLVLHGGSTEDLQTALPGIRGVRGLPVEIFVGRDGTVREVKNGYGYSKRWAKKLRKKLEGLLAESAD